MRGVGLVVVASVGVVSGAASAQEAVQWRVEDGGNGHWYAVRSESPVLVWNMASELATTSGGYLATIADAEENAFLFALTNARAACGGTTDQEGPWLGGFRSPASGYWSWVTGEPFAFDAWCLNHPSVSACSVPETVLNFKRDPLCSETLNWGDVPESGYCSPWLPASGTTSSNGPPTATLTASSTTARSSPASSPTRTPTTSPTAAKLLFPATAPPTSTPPAPSTASTSRSS